MVEPNWDKINAKKRKEIMLGQAMNQAKDILIASKKEYATRSKLFSIRIIIS